MVEWLHAKCITLLKYSINKKIKYCVLLKTKILSNWNTYITKIEKKKHTQNNNNKQQQQTIQWNISVYNIEHSFS